MINFLSKIWKIDQRNYANYKNYFPTICQQLFTCDFSVKIFYTKTVFILCTKLSEIQNKY